MQDPLAELVKVDPKSIGVGQYQHDVDQRRLKQSLEASVESCVNRVGVDLNTASWALLRYVASYGFFVVAANSREVGSGSPAPMLHALDFAAAANKDSTSPYYGKLDMTKVGAMGHSQGSAATATAAKDPRIQDIILFNTGDTAPKPYLAISGDTDITFYTPSTMAAAVDASTVPAAWLYFHQIDVIGRSFSGHLTLQTQPERVVEPTKDWWQMMLQGDTKAQSEFVGPNCGLCGDAGAQEFGENNLP